MSIAILVFIILNGSPLNFGQHQFYLDSGVTTVPLRMFMEEAGATVTYDSAKSETLDVYNNKKLIFPKSGGAVIVNGKAEKLEMSMVQENGAYYVPLRFLVEQMNGALSYDASTRTATVTVPAPSIAQEQQNEKQQVEKVVRQLWTAMGKADLDSLKSTLAWPSIMQEVTPMSVGASFVYRNTADFDEERKQYQSSATDKEGQDAFDITAISDIKIDVLNQSVANVTYKVTYRSSSPQVKLPDPTTLSMLTVLQKQPLRKTWKIIYTTIPQ